MSFRTATIFHSSRDGKRSEEHTSELQSHSDLVCRLLLEKKKNARAMTGEPYERHSAHAARLLTYVGETSQLAAKLECLISSTVAEVPTALQNRKTSTRTT